MIGAPLHTLAGGRPNEWRRVFSRFGSVTLLSTADIDAPLWTNKQQIAVRLAEAIPVLYLESLGLRAPRPSMGDVSRIARRARRAFSPERPLDLDLPDSLEVVSPVLIPYHAVRGLSILNQRLLRRQLVDRIRRLPKPRLLWSYSPLGVWLQDGDLFDAVVYHCVDDLATQPRMPKRLLHLLEPRFSASATLNFASAPELERRLKAWSSRVVLTPNVCDWGHFATALAPGPTPADLDRVPSRRAVFLGALSDYKIDWELLKRVTELLPSWSFVFIGPVGAETRMTGAGLLRGRANCHFLGLKTAADLPGYLRGADVALLPYAITEHTRSVFPLKAIEYLAAGLPVVSTPLDALTSDSHLPIEFARTAEAFADAITAQDASPKARAERSLVVSRRTWDGLLDDMAGALDVYAC